MMTTKKTQLFHQATSLLADRELSKRSGIANPDGYHARTLSQKRRDLHASALAILDEHDVDAPTLAAMLEPDTTPVEPPRPQVPKFQNHSWEGEPHLDKATTRARIDAIKASLTGVVKLEESPEDAARRDRLRADSRKWK